MMPDTTRFQRSLRLWRDAPYAVMGIVELLSQTLLLRELLVVFKGNELTIGIVLASWMSLAALGASAAGRLARLSSHPGRLFVFSHATSGLLLPLGVMAARTARVWAGIPVGITLSYSTALWICVVTLLPFGLLAGAQFSFACRANVRRTSALTSTSQSVYILEAVGFVAGGLLFSLCLADGLQPVRVAFAVAALAVASCELFLVRARRTHAFRSRLASAAVVIVLIGAAVSPLAGIIERQTTQWSLPGLHVVESANSRYANLVVAQEDGQASIFLNGTYATSFPQADAFVVEPLVRFPLLLHEQPKAVLALGTGLDLLESAATDAGIEDVHYVELDPTLLTLLERWSDRTGISLRDPGQVIVHSTDIRHYLAGTGPSFDVVILHPPAPTSVQLNRLFTSGFFELCRRRMNEDGILALTVPSSEVYLSRDLARLNQSVFGALAAVFSSAVALPGDPAILLATNRTGGLSLEPSTLVSRLETGALTTSLFNTRYIELRTRSSLREWYTGSLDRVAETPINQDANPSALRYELILETTEVSPSWAQFLRLVERPLPWLILLAAAAIAPFILFVVKLRCGRHVASLVLGNVIVTNGALGTSLSAIIVFLFQTEFGYVYSAIALLTACFMGGLALGAIATQRAKRTWRTVCGFEVLLLGIPVVAFALVLLGKVHLGSAMQTAYQTALFLIAMASGFLVGGQFALALRLRWQERPGLLYALDLLGAASAAVVVSALVIPAFGLTAALAGIGTLKAGSFLLVLLHRSRWSSRASQSARLPPK